MQTENNTLEKARNFFLWVFFIFILIFMIMAEEHMNKRKSLEKYSHRIERVYDSDSIHYIKYIRYPNGVEEVKDSTKGKNIVYRYLNIDKKKDVDIMVLTSGSTYQNRVASIRIKENNASGSTPEFNYATEVLSELRNERSWSEIQILGALLFVVVLIIIYLHIIKNKTF